MCCALKKVKQTWMPWLDFEIEVFMKLILRQNIIIISVADTFLHKGFEHKRK